MLFMLALCCQSWGQDFWEPSTAVDELGLAMHQRQPPTEGMWPITFDAGKTWGFADSTGRVVIKPQWSHVYSFDNGIAKVIDMSNVKKRYRYTMFYTFKPTPGKCGYINKKGEYVIPMEYSHIDQFSTNYGDTTRFTRGSKYRSRDKYFGSANPYKGYKWGLVDYKGRIIVPDDTYDYIFTHFSHGVFVACKGCKKGVINSKGEVIIPFQRGSYSKLVDLYYEKCTEEMVN